MMSLSKEERIRTEAYKLWEMEGRPEGAHERHWLEALNTVDGEAVEAELETESATQAVEVPVVAAKPKRSKAQKASPA